MTPPRRRPPSPLPPARPQRLLARPAQASAKDAATAVVNAASAAKAEAVAATAGVMGHVMDRVMASVTEVERPRRVKAVVTDREKVVAIAAAVVSAAKAVVKAAAKPRASVTTRAAKRARPAPRRCQLMACPPWKLAHRAANATRAGAARAQSARPSPL